MKNRLQLSFPKVSKRVRLHLVHPLAEGSPPGVFLLQMEVAVKQDEINVALEVL